MKSRNPATATLCFALVAMSFVVFTACLEVRDNEDVDGGGDGCTMCHSLDGETGAHPFHVGDEGLFGGGYACEDCHPIPTEWFDEGHIDAVVEVIMPEGTLATTGGVVPEFDGARCTNVYCHGATLSGGTYTEPLWYDSTLPEGLSCGMCHGIPPLDPHPASGSCPECHSAAYTGGELDKSVHINGAVDFLGAGDGGV